MRRVNSRVRKALLTAHVLASVGWFGAAIAFLSVAFTCRFGVDPEVIRSGLLLMPLIVDRVLVPLALAAVATGVVESLTTHWGLFRHYWVLGKLALTLFATTILFTWTRTADAIGSAARSASFDAEALRALAESPVLHSVGAVIVLAGITVLAVYKPKGLTRYGWTKLQEPRPPV